MGRSDGIGKFSVCSRFNAFNVQTFNLSITTISGAWLLHRSTALYTMVSSFTPCLWYTGMRTFRLCILLRLNRSSFPGSWVSMRDSPGSNCPNRIILLSYAALHFTPLAFLAHVLMGHCLGYVRNVFFHWNLLRTSTIGGSAISQPFFSGWSLTSSFVLNFSASCQYRGGRVLVAANNCRSSAPLSSFHFLYLSVSVIQYLFITFILIRMRATLSLYCPLVSSRRCALYSSFMITAFPERYTFP